MHRGLFFAILMVLFVAKTSACRQVDKTMRRLRNHLIGIDQGELVLFSDFEDGGDMWTGNGARERRKAIQFSDSYKMPPSVQVNLTLWDVDNATNTRADIKAEKISNKGFELVFRTWGDTKVARVRMTWFAIGELNHTDDFELHGTDDAGDEAGQGSH